MHLSGDGSPSKTVEFVFFLMCVFVLYVYICCLWHNVIRWETVIALFLARLRAFCSWAWKEIRCLCFRCCRRKNARWTARRQWCGWWTTVPAGSSLQSDTAKLFHTNQLSSDSCTPWLSANGLCVRGATTAEKLRGTTKARLGVGCGRGSPLPTVRVRGYHPWKFLKSHLVVTCCEISCFLKTTATEVGEPIHCWSPSSHGCCAYAVYDVFKPCHCC